MEEALGGISGTGPLDDLFLWNLDIRRKLFLTLEIFDLSDVIELREAEVMDVAANEGVFLCLRCSTELSELVWMDCEARGGVGSC